MLRKLKIKEKHYILLSIEDLIFFIIIHRHMSIFNELILLTRRTIL
jgi:hypothetical protein